MTVDELLSSMTERELAQQLSGRRGLHALTPWTYRLAPYESGGCDRLGLAPLRFCDGPRGVNLGRSTCFPSASTRGASWDPALEEEVAEAMGREARAAGATAMGSACLNLVRHPGWGRAQEALGSDPVHVGVLGAAHVRGLGRHVVPIIKHFAVNSIEKSRFRVDVDVEPDVLREVYLPQFREAIEAGASGVMTAYNQLQGTYCGESRLLIETILRGEWGFPGFVTSDFFLGCRDGAASLSAGLDLEMPQGFHMRPGRLLSWLRAGKISRERLETSAGRILRAREAHAVLEVAAAAPPPRDDHEALALRSALAGIVVARDSGGVLPLDRRSKVGLIGRLADRPNTGSEGSVSTKAPWTISLLDGMKETFSRVEHEPRLREAPIRRLAARVDVLVLAVGAGARDEGEYFPLLGGGDRASPELPAAQLRALTVALTSGRPVILVWFGGGLPTLHPITDGAPVVVFAGHGGMQGGRALAEALAGISPASGFLPYCVARSGADLPPFDPDAGSALYDRLFDYRLHDRSGSRPVFPLGAGAAGSHVSLEVREPQRSRLAPEEPLEIPIRLRNEGDTSTAALVLAFARRPFLEAERETRVLVGFVKCTLGRGEERSISLVIDLRRLERWSEERGEMKVPPGAWWIDICRSSDESGASIAVEVSSPDAHSG